MESVLRVVLTPQQNCILTALSTAALNSLFPRLEQVLLPQGKVLYEPGNSSRYVYFPTDSIISLSYVMEDGTSTEVSMVGKEGCAGITMFMGSDSTPDRAVVQSTGSAYRLPGQQLKEELDRNGELQHQLLRYIQARITQISQTAACYRHHHIDQQLCRWLLMYLDRVPDNRMHMTQELIAHTLGVRREGVTEAAGKLQKLGAIEYHRGHITVLDRSRLERLCCECYALVKKEIERLLHCTFTPAGACSASVTSPV